MASPASAPKGSPGGQSKGQPKGSPTEPSEGQPKGQQAPRANRRSAIIGALFLAAVLVGNFVYIQVSGQADDFGRALAQVAPGWLWAMAAMMAGNLVFGAAAFAIACRLDPNARLSAAEAVAVESAGTFFGNLTPGSAGSVPGQIWRLARSGYSVGEATAVQLTRFCVYQIAQSLFGGVLLVAFWGNISRTYGHIVWVGFGLVVFKLLQTAVLVLLCLFPGFVRRVSDAGLGRLGRWGWSRKVLGEARLEGWRQAVEDETSKFGHAFRKMAASWRTMAWVLVVSMLQVGCLYGTDWFALRAFGADPGFLVTLCLGTLVQLTASVVPTPGGTGGIEAAFLVFFSRYLGEGAVACFLVWRVVTFYGYTALTGLLTFLPTRDDGHPRVRRRGPSGYHLELGT